MTKRDDGVVETEFMRGFRAGYEEAMRVANAVRSQQVETIQKREYEGNMGTGRG